MDQRRLWGASQGAAAVEPHGHGAERVALENVLNTPELMLNILLNVDMRTLLTSVPRVCRQWHKLTGGSTPIQKALYLKPDFDATPRHINPLLAKAFPGFVGEGKLKHLNTSEFSNISLAAEGNKELFMRKDASWRKMLISQPPARALGNVKIKDTQVAYPSKALDRIRRDDFPEGLRMGKLYDLLVEWVYESDLVRGFMILSNESHIKEWMDRDEIGEGLCSSGQRKSVRLFASTGTLFVRYEGHTCALGALLSPSFLQHRKEFLSKFEFTHPRSEDYWEESDDFPSSITDDEDELERF
ncbi:hypothetical protein HJFPF1_08573 [Paramyrothecium foliicola]|nr:hypothetical protein HJFPF1_08573 [Paramyrothecium foliicola]